MKMLVLGSNGMLGHVVYNYFKEQNYEVYGTICHYGDGIFFDAFSNMEELENIIQQVNPNIIVNCIGILNKAAEDNKLLAVKLNSLLPHYIDSLSQKYHFKVEVKHWVK